MNPSFFGLAQVKLFGCIFDYKQYHSRSIGWIIKLHV